MSPENNDERYFFLFRLYFFFWAVGFKPVVLPVPGVILKHFAPKNDGIEDLEASGAHSGVGKDSYWC